MLSDCDSEPGDVWATFESNLNAIILPKDDRFQERPCVHEDFVELVPKIEQNFASLLSRVEILPQISIEKLSLDERAIFVRLILACKEHAEEFPWTSNFSRESSKEILNSLSLKCSGQNPKDLILHPNFLKQAWLNLCSKLSRDCWKSHPAAVQCFSWIVFQLESPTLGEHLMRVFPTTLVILDDWETENKILGCRIMNHIIDNVTRAELRRQQFDDVVFDILQRLIYERESRLVLEVVKCLAALVTKVDHRYNQPFEIGRYDIVLKVLLGQMEMEQGLKLRLVYAESLPILLSSGSVCLMMWSQRIFRILAEYTNIEDDSQGLTQLFSVKALLIFLQKTWPRAHSYASQSLSTLLRLLMGLTKDTPSIKADKHNRDQIFEIIGQCLQIVSSSAPEKCRELLEGIKKVPASEQFHQIVKSNEIASIGQ